MLSLRLRLFFPLVSSVKKVQICLLPIGKTSPSLYSKLSNVRPHPLHVCEISYHLPVYSTQTYHVINVCKNAWEECFCLVLFFSSISFSLRSKCETVHVPRFALRARRPLREHARLLPLRLPARLHGPEMRGQHQRVREQPLHERGHLHRREGRIQVHLHAR